MQLKEINFSEIKQFSERDKDYTIKSEVFSEFIAYPFEFDAFKKIIENRSQFKTDRSLLFNTLTRQYEGIESSKHTIQNISSLNESNTFTITTAHQPSLLTGPLYYPFKILSTIQLCLKLKETFKDYHFVPVFILGAEDHDFEEINHLELFGRRLEWHSQGNGAVGRFQTDGIDKVLDDVREILGDKSAIIELIEAFDTDLNTSKDYAEFSFKITHRLFDKYGLVILRMDDRVLKSAFTDIIKEEIFNAPSQPLIEESQQSLEKLGYGKQAHAREINFFYLNDQGRKRIVHEGEKYKVLDTELEFSKNELEKEIDEHPSRFSPNVVTRPLYQELILPNLAYIGGGGELAYWMERKTQFEYFKLPFPMLIRRNSALLCPQRLVTQIESLGLKLEDFFEDEHEIIKKYIQISDQPDYSLELYSKELDKVFESMEEKIKTIDPTLVKTSQSELAKTKKSIEHIEFKLKRNIKQREEVQLKRIEKIKEKLFPNGLQERQASILEFMSMYGEGILPEMLPHMNVFEKKMKIFILP